MSKLGTLPELLRPGQWRGRGVGLRAYLFGCRISSAVLGLAQLSVLARVLSPVEFAAVAAATAAASYVALLGEPAILGYERIGHHDREHDSDVGGARSVANALTVGLMILAPAVALVVGWLFGDATKAFAVAIWAVSLVQLRWISVQLLNWQEQARFATTTLINSAARVAAMLVAAVVTGSGVVVLICGAAASMITVAIIAPRQPRWAVTREALKGLIKVGFPLTIASAAVSSMSSWPTLVGHAQLSAETFANYAAQVSLAGAFYGATAGFVLLFGWPQAKKLWDTQEHGASRRVVDRYASYSIAIAIGGVLMFWFLGDQITRILLGPNYVGHAIPAYAIAMLGVSGLAGLVSWSMRLAYQQNRWATIVVAAALIQIPVVYFATVRGGLLGLMLGILSVASLQTLVALLIARPPRLLIYLGVGSGMAVVSAICALAAVSG